jgi:hypothetical protein
VSESEDLSPGVMLVRLKLLERELDELRTELRASYLNKDQLMNAYLSRADVERSATKRREWPMIVAAIVMGACSVVTVIVTLAHA